MILKSDPRIRDLVSAVERMILVVGTWKLGSVREKVTELGKLGVMIKLGALLPLSSDQNDMKSGTIIQIKFLDLYTCTVQSNMVLLHTLNDRHLMSVHENEDKSVG